MPYDRHQVDKYDNPSITPTSELITYMTRVHIPININSLIKFLRCIIGDFFLDVTVKLKPLYILVEAFIKLIFNIHIGKVHNKLGLGMILKIYVYIEPLFYIAATG